MGGNPLLTKITEARIHETENRPVKKNMGHLLERMEAVGSTMRMKEESVGERSSRLTLPQLDLMNNPPSLPPSQSTDVDEKKWLLMVISQLLRFPKNEHNDLDVYRNRGAIQRITMAQTKKP